MNILHTRHDQRGQRAWVRVQLQDNAPSHQTASIIAEWKLQRQAAANVMKAIQLYAALCRGDLSVLMHCFPGLALTWSGYTTVPQRPAAPSYSAPMVTYSNRSELEDLDDALDGLGLDNLDFDLSA